jgi:hypothetical protein
MMLNMVPRLLLMVVVLFAFRKGEEPERLVGVILLAAFLLDLGNHAVFGDPAWFAINPGHVVIDTWTFASLLWVALRANRGWPLWASAAQVIVIMAHIAKLWDPGIVRKAYWAMTQMPLILQLVILALGTLAHVARARRIGWYHSWRLPENGATA